MSGVAAVSGNYLLYLQHISHTTIHLGGAVGGWSLEKQEHKMEIVIVKLREREGQGVDPGRSLKGHL